MEDSHGSAVQWNKPAARTKEDSSGNIYCTTAIYRNSVELMNGELFNRTSQIESFTLEGRAHVVAIMNHWKAESLGTAIMVIIKKL